MNRWIFALGILCAPLSCAVAQPFITEDVPTLGKYTFEAGFSASRRNDNFNSPKASYSTVVIPARIRLGLSPKVDFGLTFEHITHTVKAGDQDISGSRSGLLAPELKYSPFEDLGFLLIWHKSAPEKDDGSLSIVRGNDIELLGLFSVPFRVPLTINVGYLWRDSYRTTFGVPGEAASTVHPGNIFETRAAMEFPLVYHFGLIAEGAYYRSDSERVNGTGITDSAGDAMDAMGGLSWTYLGWAINGGVGFGLLKERFTSFDLERGAGDTRYQFSLAYRITPKRPG